MTKLKILLGSKYLLILIIIFTIIHSLTYHDNLSKSDIYVIKSIKRNDDKLTIISNNVLINYYGTEDYKIGDKILVEGSYTIPDYNTNFNLFNYRLYLKSIGINYILNASKIEKVSSSNNIFYKIKNSMIERIYKYHSYHYLLSFILGDTNYIENDIKISLKENGISHLFSVSGMHVSLLSIVIINILNKFKKSDFNYVFVSLFLILYMFLVSNIGVIRSVIIFILNFINKKFNLNIKTIYLYVYLICFFLIYNPYLIYNVGFQFSFTISIFLNLYSVLINQYHNYFAKIFMISLISFMVSIPILINTNFSINIMSPFINVLFVPLISLIIFPLSLLVFIIPILEPILNIFIHIFEYLTFLFNKFNVDIIMSHMSIIFVLLYYLIIIYILHTFKYHKYYNILILALIIFIHHNIYNFNNELHFINVGQGDASLLRLKNKAVLIDTGGNKNYDVSNNILIPYLKSIGIKKIDLIISHGDYDHMGGSINLVNNFKVEKVIFNCGEYNDLEKELINVLNKKKIKYYSCIKELNIDNNKLYFLQTKVYDNENDNSNVIITELGGYKFMFMGDAGITTEKEIIDKYNLPDIDVLKVGHHGSKTSSNKEFIDEVNPKYSIISVGKKNRYGHPNKEVLNTLSNSKVYRTDEDGSIMFKIKNNRLKIETCSP